MNQARNSTIFFGLSLLFVFAGCSFLLLSAQIQGSHRLEQRIDAAYTQYTPISYITMKVHSYDHDGGVDVQMIQDVSCLVLSDSKTKTYIYYEDGELKELYTIHTMIPDLKDGDVIMECESFSIQKKEDTLTGSVGQQSFIIQIRSEGYYA